MNDAPHKPIDEAVQVEPPRFVTGSILRHILVLTGTSAIGLMSIFVGELLSIVFLSLLRDVELLAAIGFAQTILFFLTSVGIGLSIATTTVVSPVVGAGDQGGARRISTNAILFAGLAAATVALALLPVCGAILAAIGARGRVHALAHEYLLLVIPTLPLTAIGMSCMAALRSFGDAPRAMNVMLAGAGVTLALEPFCLFILKLGMTGSALAGIAGRMAFASVGLVGVFLIHRMYTRPERAGLMRDIRAILATAIPAVATNVATPFANLYTTAALAAVDDAAIAAWTVIARLTPVAFGAVFCLTGAVGPVIGQNLGARAADRVHATFTAALKTNTVFCVVACVALALLSPALPGWFGLAGRAAEIVRFYCLYVAPLWLFLGYLFVANAVFNTLGRAHFATALNWGRATLGTIPLVWLGGRLAGAEGIVFASMAGAIVVGLLSVWLARRTLPVVA